MNRQWKWLRSFFLREWTLQDYPVRVQKHVRPAGPGLSPPPPWTAQFEGWWQMAGFGGSSEAARQDLAAKFDDYCLHGRPLHRPGAEVPIILGTYQDEMEELEEQEEREKKQSIG